eukprot:scaffold138729_cov29-Tisochrysis_lutea.AAC.1
MCTCACARRELARAPALPQRLLWHGLEQHSATNFTVSCHGARRRSPPLLRAPREKAIVIVLAMERAPAAPTSQPTAVTTPQRGRLKPPQPKREPPPLPTKTSTCFSLLPLARPHRGWEQAKPCSAL